MMAMTYLGMTALQELQPCGNCAEKVTHRQGSTFRRSCCSNFGDVPIDCTRLRPLCSAAMMAEQRDFGNCGNTCQGFAAKAERTNVLQVIYPGYFARGMPGKRQFELNGRNACAIIGDADKL